jgi:hypothetical protein
MLSYKSLELREYIILILNKAGLTYNVFAHVIP